MDTRTLQVGDRVRLEGEPNTVGRITEADESKYVIVLWDGCDLSGWYKRAELEFIAPTYACQNCTFTTTDRDQLRTVADIHQRVEPGERMPAGECPECGALVHLDCDQP